MLIEVHSGEKPAIARRAWVTAILLFLVVMALAAGMTWGRAGNPLARRIEPGGSAASLRPPRTFRPGPRIPTGTGSAYTFLGMSSAGAKAMLLVHCPDGILRSDSLTFCSRVLSQDFPQPKLAGLIPLIGFGRKLGSHDAVEIWDPVLNVVVRGLVLESGAASAVSLGVEGDTIDKEMYELFDATCRSIEFQGS